MVNMRSNLLRASSGGGGESASAGGGGVRRAVDGRGIICTSGMFIYNSVYVVSWVRDLSSAFRERTARKRKKDSPFLEAFPLFGGKVAVERRGNVTRL
jgi:hypothetical protein